METSTNLGRVSLVPRGEYDPAAQYERLDVVGYGGAGYLVLRPVQGVVPANGADYMLISEKGGKGDKGDQGEAAGFGTVSAAVDETVGTPSVEVSASGPDTAKEFAFSFHGLKGQQGIQGDKGDPGSNIASIERTAGTGAPGTRDTYTITLTDGTTSTFQVYNGADGVGAGDMTAAVYDPQGRAQDIFQYVDDHTPKDAVTVPGGGTIEMGESLGEGPYIFEYEEDGEGSAVRADQVSYDSGGSGLEAATVQGALDALSAVKADVSRVSNPNLLDNPNFAIWQRYPNGEFTGVPNGTYIADRFIITSSNGSIQSKIVRVDGGGIKNLSGPPCVIFQRIENAAQYNGMTLTQSFLYELNGNQRLKSYTLIAVDWTDTTDVLGTAESQAWIMEGETLLAAKLELGSQQTLAHQDASGNWVLNDPPPDKTLELLKCQRYFKSIGGVDTHIVGQVNYAKANEVVVNVPGVPMRAAPTLSYKPLHNSSAAVFDGQPHAVTGAKAFSDKLFMILIDSDLPAKGPAAVYLNEDIWLSAEL